jgi:hypothetical protein
MWDKTLVKTDVKYPRFMRIHRLTDESSEKKGEKREKEGCPM